MKTLPPQELHCRSLRFSRVVKVLGFPSVVNKRQVIGQSEVSKERPCLGMDRLKGHDQARIGMMTESI